MADSASCSFVWTIRNHPAYDECSDQWCQIHAAWRREGFPREFCEAVPLAGPALVKCAVCGKDCMTWLPDDLPVCEPCDIEIEGGTNGT